MFQTTPRPVISNPPSLLMVPPETAEKEVIEVTGSVSSWGGIILFSFLQEVADKKLKGGSKNSFFSFRFKRNRRTR